MADQVWKKWISEPETNPREAKEIADLKASVAEAKRLYSVLEAEHVKMVVTATEVERLKKELTTAQASVKSFEKMYTASCAATAKALAEKQQLTAQLEALKPIAERYAAEQAETERQREFREVRLVSRFAELEAD